MNLNQPFGCTHRSAGQTQAGLTRLEVLVLVVTVAIVLVLAVLLIPGSKNHPRSAACQDNLRQLTLGWCNYPVDNQDQLMPNPGWVSGQMGWEPGAGLPDYFDQQLLMNPERSLMTEYIKNPAAYKCPADTYKLPEYPRERVRSYAANGVLTGARGSGAKVQGTGPEGRNYFGKGITGDGGPARKLGDLLKPGPAQVFVIVDEHPDSVVDATFMFDPGYAAGSERWRDLPASGHRGAGSISFADGRVELHQWEETKGTNTTLYPVTMTTGTPWAAQPVGTSRDYEWLQERMPYR